MFTGRILRDPELKRFKGRNVCVFTAVVATGKINRETGIEITNFYDCSLWGDNAEELYSIIHKGTIISAVGSMYQHEYVSNGEKKHRIRVEIVNIKVAEHRIAA